MLDRTDTIAAIRDKGEPSMVSVYREHSGRYGGQGRGWLLVHPGYITLARLFRANVRESMLCGSASSQTTVATLRRGTRGDLKVGS